MALPEILTIFHPNPEAPQLFAGIFTKLEKKILRAPGQFGDIEGSGGKVEKLAEFNHVALSYKAQFPCLNDGCGQLMQADIPGSAGVLFQVIGKVSNEILDGGLAHPIDLLFANYKHLPCS
jgi:hypothetical protein